MDKRVRQYNLDLDFRLAFGAFQVNVLCLNFEAPVPGWEYALHSHSSYELHFIPRGKGELRVGRRRYEILPGTLYLTGPGVFHEQKADLLDPMSEFCLNIEVIPQRSRSRDPDSRLAEEQDAMLAALSSSTFWFGPDRFSTIPLFEELFAEMEGGGLGSYTRIQCLLTLVIINALRNFAPRRGAKGGKSELPRKSLRESRRFLIDRYFDQATEPSREELASLIGASVRQLNRVLVEFYDMSFIEKLNHSRLEKAADLLQTSQLSVQEISDRLGFSSQGYFSSRFHERYGVPPSRFRQKGTLTCDNRTSTR
jgi:AraC family 4-hydroxyphenylacetate 3-monooxygenase operon regulatory protein